MCVRYIVLVEPEVPENTGFIARLCENFNFGLRVLRPEFNLSEARKTANNAQEKLRNTEIFDGLDEEVKDLDFVVGTKPGKGVSSKEFSFRENTSIMLGRESSGLSNSELEICDAVIHIESDYSSLNLSHAASVLMYEAYQPENKAVNNKRLEFVEREYGGYLRDLISRASPTDEEIDRLLGELNR